MSNLRKGSKIWCTPTRIDTRNEVVYVKIHGGNSDVRMVLRELFFEDVDAAFGFFDGAIVRHEPYDVVRIDCPFVAKVIDNHRLSLSRKDRIRDLWQELEQKSRHADFVLARITGQNRLEYTLNIEGNLSLRCSKVELDHYLDDLFWDDRKRRRRYSPVEGDTVVAAVTAADASRQEIALDLVDPLQCLESGGLAPEILRLFGSQVSKVNTGASAIGAKPASTAARPLALAIDHSEKLDKQRNATHALVVDDDIHFRVHLAWLLTEMGYQGDPVEPPDCAEDLAARITDETVFLIDANMEPIDGISLVRDLRAYADAKGLRCRCVVVTALAWDEPFEKSSRCTLGEAVEELAGTCLFWRKSAGDIELRMQQLDDLILHFDERIDRKQYISSNFGGRSSVPKEPAETVEDVIAGKRHDVSQILDTLKRETNAHWAGLFEMDRHAWRVELLAGDPLLQKQCRSLGAQSYLPNSPIRDISYKHSRILIENRVDVQSRRYLNLLRFFRHDSLDAPVTQAHFRSAAGIRLDIGTSRKYSLFVFGKSVDNFPGHKVIPYLYSASEQLELILVKQIHARQMRNRQGFYLEGLARAGLRHDVGAQLADIEALAEYVIPDELQKGHMKEVNKFLRDLSAVAKEARQRILDSLDMYGEQSSSERVDLRETIEHAKRIAVGVAARTGNRRRKVEITHAYPDHVSPVVNGNANAIHRVLENLVVNSVEHGLALSTSNIAILLEIQETNDPLFPYTILIHDNGPGIHGMDRPYVFDPLYSTKSDGYGMGLANVQAIAEENSLIVKIAESAILVGTTFAVHVPVDVSQRVKTGHV